MKTSLVAFLAALALYGSGRATEITTSAWPEPGTVFVENSYQPGRDAWRVTDADAARYYEAAKPFLPNPRLPVPAPAAEFLSAARRATLIIDYWNGHPGTTDKALRLDDGPWLAVDPQLAGALPGESAKHTAQFNLSIDVPLATLADGQVLLEGRCGPNGFRWGQWGWYGFLLRVELDPARYAAHPAQLRVASGSGASSLTDFPEIELIAPPDAPAIAEVRLFARYEGPDENGDGITLDWHGFYQHSAWRGHVATLTSAPWRTRWDTTWIPDQKPGTICLIAHVRDARGVWTVTPALTGVTLERPDHRIVMHPAYRLRPFFWVRDGQIKSALIPTGTADDPRRATAAVVHLRGWNLLNNEQTHTPLRVNAGQWLTHITGRDHFYSDDYFPLAPSQLQAGDNLLTFTSSTKHHGPELLWPGPTLLLRYPKKPTGDTAALPPPAPHSP